MVTAINFRSKKVRRELWMLFVAAVVVAIGYAWAQSGLEVSTEVPLIQHAEQKTEQKITSPTKVVPKEVPSSQPMAGVVSIANSIPEASTFTALLSSSGVASNLNVNGTYTLFVPTNAAMQSIAGMLASMSAAEKKRFLQYHLIADRAVDTDAMKAGYVDAISRDPLNFVVIGDQQTVRVNSSKVVGTYTGKNGVVYLIDAPLLPPKKAQ